MRRRTAQAMALLAVLYWVLAIALLSWIDWRLGAAVFNLTVATTLIDLLPSR